MKQKDVKMGKNKGKSKWIRTKNGIIKQIMKERYQ
jgi:hypothetical protein